MPDGDDLISKKALLAETGISYGQLYRWKRKDLIPEEWFVRRSTFTGQETFFPRERILARVARIQELMRADLSLDDIAEILSPSPSAVSVPADEALARGLVSRRALDLAGAGTADVLRFEELLRLGIAEELLADGAPGREAAEAALRTLAAVPGTYAERDAVLLLVGLAGRIFGMVAPRDTEPELDPEARVVARLGLTERIERLKRMAGGA